MKPDVELARIHFSRVDYASLVPHLRQNELEQAAFLYVERDGGPEVRVREVELLGPDDFVSQEAYYLELSDAARARGLKRAHDLGLGLAEAHVHPDQAVACFSPSDLSGLREFAPHVWWRRRGGPFAALVLGAHGWDGLAWIDAPDRVRRLEGLVVEGRMERASGASWKKL